MERLSIYEYKDYKKYLLDWIARAPHKGRGQRKLLAEAMGCQTPFVTHVLSGEYHLSLEQAEACSRFLGLAEADSEFFLLLVIQQRAGSRGLENMAKRQISKRREQASVLQKRLNIKDEMTVEDQATYYSHWHYCALHMACLIPELQTVEALQRHFNLPLNQVLGALDFLSEHHLIERSQTGALKVLRPILHLGKDSPLLWNHHTQWRLRAIDSLQHKNEADLFYSGVASLSQDDFEWVRERLSQLLQEVVERVKDSRDETLACLNFDFYRL